MEASHAPVQRKYSRKALHSEDFSLTQKEDIDLDQPIVHGESLAQVMGDVGHAKEQIANLAFAEEPVTILIEENTRSDNPETHVYVSCNGKDAEVFENGQWLTIGWVPIGREVTLKRKIVEILVRSKSESVKTIHDDANIERPRNTVRRTPSANYPVTILDDRSPRGREWFAQLRREH